MKRALPILIAVVLSIGATPAIARAATQADVYNPTCVSEIQLTASAQAIANLYADPKGAYQPATLEFDVCGNGNEVLGPIVAEFRLKGSGSFQTLDGKAAFKVKMSKNPTGNRIDGLKSLTLNNMIQDPSSLHETLAYAAFRGVGLKASRAGYANVKLTNSDTGVTTDFGLHANIESLDDRFAAANFGSMQHLYEQPDWQLGFGTFASRDLLPGNANSFELQEGSDASRSDLEALTQTYALPDDADWWAALQPLIDVDAVMKFWATEFYLGDDDNYVNFVNNYYLHSTTAGVFTFMPWGTDKSFRDDVPLFGNASASPLVTRCLNFAPCRSEYRDALGEVAEAIIGLDLVTMAHEVQDAIVDSVAADPRDFSTSAQQCKGVDDTIKFLIDREALWRLSFRDPSSAISSAQSSERLACELDDPSDPQPALSIAELLTPLKTASDTTAPRLKSVSVRKLRKPADRASAAGGRVRLNYRLTIVASDHGSGVASVQIRTFGNRIRTRQLSQSPGKVDLATGADQIRIRVLDRSANAGKWKTVRLQR